MKVYIIRDNNNVVLEVYDNKELVKKLIPHIEAKMLVDISSIEEKTVNPTVDFVGNPNFSQVFTLKEFLESV